MISNQYLGTGMFASQVEVIKLINYLILQKICVYEILLFCTCFMCRNLVSSILFGIKLLTVFKFQFTFFCSQLFCLDVSRPLVIRSLLVFLYLVIQQLSTVSLLTLLHVCDMPLVYIFTSCHQLMYFCWCEWARMSCLHYGRRYFSDNFSTFIQLEG